MSPIVQERFQDPSEAASSSLTVHQRPQGRGKSLVILIHGLNGRSYGHGSSWGAFPRLLFESRPKIDIGFFSYESGIQRTCLGRSVAIEDQSRVLADSLRDLDAYAYVCLVGHSMGGILAKSALAHLVSTGQRKVLRRIGGLLLLGVPQAGSLRIPYLLNWVSSDFRVLKAHNRHLTTVNEILNEGLDIREDSQNGPARNIPTWAVIAAGDFWVSRLSAGLGIPQAQTKTLILSHSALAKPSALEGEHFQWLLARIDRSTGRPRAQIGPIERHRCAPVAEDGVAALHAFATTMFGEDITPAQMIADWLSADPDCAWVIHRESDQGEGLGPEVSIVGYFCILRLSASAATLVANGELKGSGIASAHFAKEDEVAPTRYVGAIAGTDASARAAVLSELESYLREQAAEAQFTLLTRPVTEDGLRIARLYGLLPVNKDLSGIGHVYQGKYTPRASRRRKAQ